MSNNCETLIQKHNGKFYIFQNVMAESWSENKMENELPINENVGVFDNFEDAFRQATQIDHEEQTEYGVHFEELIKDGTQVKIV